MCNKLPRTPIYQLHDTGLTVSLTHDDVIKWKRFPRYWPFVRGIRRSPVNSPRKGQWRGALMFSLICAWLNAWVNSRKVGDLRRHRAHYDVIVIFGENQCTIGRVNCYVILMEPPTMLLVPICRDMQLWWDKSPIPSSKNRMPGDTCFDDVSRICACVTWTQMYVTLQTKNVFHSKALSILFLISLFLARWLTSARAYRIGGRKLCPSVCLYVKRYLLLQFCTDYNQTWINMIWAVAAKTLLSQIFHNWRRIEVNCVYISHCKWYRTSAGMPACIPNRRCCAGQCAGQ